MPNRHGVRITQHERVRQDDRQGSGAELIRVAGPPGYSGLLITPVGRAPVLEDLRLQLRLKTDRPGAQLAIRVVFPRETDPATGQGLTRIVRGPGRAAGLRTWEDLSIDNAPELVRRFARVIGSSLGRSIDERGAYVDAVVLIVPSDLQATSVWVDELTLYGHLAPGEDSATGQTDEAPIAIRQVRLSEGGLTIDERAFYPRIISHQGEPLAELQKLGFNTIAFAEAPSEHLREECQRLKLAYLCPPPAPAELTSQTLAAKWDGAIAWLLPLGGDRHAVDMISARADSLRQADQHLRRPLLAQPTEAWGVWSRLADGLLLPPAWAPTGQMRVASQSCYTEAVRFARPGTPVFATTPLTHSPEFLQQVTAFAPAGTVQAWRPPGEVAEEAIAAAVAGARGVWITRDAPLTAANEDQRVRQGLALLNLQLTLLEPWLRDGRRVGQIAAQQPGRSAVLLQRRRTRLLIPQAPGDRQAPGPIAYVAPGVSEASKAYAFTTVGMRQLPVTRMAGGVRLSVDSPDAWVLITDDARAAAEVQRRVRSVARRAGALQQAIAVAELRHAEAHLSPLVIAAGSRSPDAAVLNEARRMISAAKTAQSTNDADSALRHASQATRLLSNWSRRRVAGATTSAALESSPLAGQASTVIDHERLLQLLKPLARGPNLLAGGAFEDHQSTAQAGWTHYARESSSEPATVSFSAQSAAQGTRSLRIECPEGDSPLGVAAVEISSPEVALRAGQLVEVTGMVRVAKATNGGAMVISDSLGGPELGLALDRPHSWRPFRLLRRATTDERLLLTFSAQGAVTADLDAVMVRTVELPSAAKAAVLGVPAFQRK